jgi:hypothetical protein
MPANIEELSPLLGEWNVEASIAPPGLVGTAVFEWMLGGAYLLQRVDIPHPQAPDALCVIAPQGEVFMQHYFDSRGVTRLYVMTFDGTEWTLTRERPDFSPHDFSQRYTGRLTPDGQRIDGRWEMDRGGGYELDFELNYVRAGS